MHDFDARLETLDQEQQQAVLHSPGTPLVIVAGPGAGKTSVLTHRVAKLVLKDQIEPHRVLGVTFTNRAAGEMKKRLQAILGRDVASRLYVGTFHGICAQLLRAYGGEVGVERNFKIYNDDNAVRLLHDVIDATSMPPLDFRVDDGPLPARGAWVLLAYVKFTTAGAPFVRAFHNIKIVDSLAKASAHLCWCCNQNNDTGFVVQGVGSPEQTFFCATCAGTHFGSAAPALKAFHTTMGTWSALGAFLGYAPAKTYARMRSRVASFMYEEIDRYKNIGVTAEQVAVRADSDYATHIADVYARYEAALSEQNAVDFGNILLKTRLMLKDSSNVVSEIQNKFSHVLVDEYQDTNIVQHDIVLALVERSRSVTVVADDDQSIYRWRGALVGNFLNFGEHVGGDFRVVKLTTNYRCTQNVVEVSKALIARNQNRYSKDLHTKNPIGSKITIHSDVDDKGEAAFIANQISLIQAETECALADFLIVFRTNSQAHPIETVFRSRNISTRVIGATSFFDRRQTKFLAAWLHVIDNGDDYGLLRILNMPARGLSDKFALTLKAYAKKRNEKLEAALRDIVQHPHREVGLTKKQQLSAKAFLHLIDTFRSEFAQDGLSGGIQKIASTTGFYEHVEGDEDLQKHQALIDDFSQDLNRYADETDEPTLGGFLEQSSLSAGERDPVDADQDAVVLMTAHKCKGLEFPYVFAVGLNEGLWPSAREKADPEIHEEEERRLLYVALTRATSAAFITTTHLSFRHGKTIESNPSKFLLEIEGLPGVRKTEGTVLLRPRAPL